EKVRPGNGRTFVLRMWSVQRIDRNGLAPAEGLEANDPVRHGEQRVIAPQLHVLAGVEVGPLLADQDRARGDVGAAVALHPEILGVAVAAVPTRAYAFL